MHHRLPALLLACPLVCTPGLTQKDPWWQHTKKALAASDYGKFEQLGSAILSPDGRFCAWTIRLVYGDVSLRLCRLGADGRDGERKEWKHASRPAFSGDNRFLAFSLGVSQKERERMEKAKKPIKSKLGLVDLKSGKLVEVDGVRSFRFDDGGRFLVMDRARTPGQKGGGDIVVRDLSTGVDTAFGHIGQHAWADDATLLAMVVDTPDRIGNAVRVYDAATGVLRTLDSTKSRYRSLRWRQDAADLAVLRAIEKDEAKGKAKGGAKKAAKADGGDGGKSEGASKSASADDEEHQPHIVLAWRGLDGATPRPTMFDPRKAKAFAKGERIVRHRSLQWSREGDVLFFGFRAKGAAAKIAKGAPGTQRAELDESAGVEVWHAKDVEIVPRQKKTGSRDRNKSYLGALWLADGKFVRLGDELTEDVTLLRRGPWALGRDNSPYETTKRFGPTLVDVHLIDTRDGTKKKLLERRKFLLGGSPDGRFFAYVKDGALWTYEIAADAHHNLTEGVAGDFINDERKVLTDENPPYGVAGWTEDGSRVYVHSRWDLWSFACDGSGPERLTQGEGERVRYRRTTVEPEPDRRNIIDPARPILLTVYGDRTKKSGFARLHPDGKVESLVLRDKNIGRLVKAEDADVYAYVEQAFDDSPDAFVADAAFRNRFQISETNPFQKGFHWGRGELIDYENAHGQALQGALFYPANYEPGKRYPMITYIYEMRSQNLHRWSAPTERNAYNPTVFTSKGYFVYQPDIVYRAQNPGVSAQECVVPAVEKVLERDDIDRTKVGLVGHSWGAYQTAFLVTHCDLFAAGVAGAPLTNMISMSMSIYWNSGQTDTWIFHESQGRMDTPFWKDLDTYVANSPIFGIEDLKTPLLIAFGDEDGAVDWQQGVEFYNAARLAQKPVVMLVYPGENHGLRKKPNQVDYHHRVLAWFDHHLKGQKAPKWITEGQAWLERERELKALKRSRKKAPTKAK